MEQNIKLIWINWILKKWLYAPHTDPQAWAWSEIDI